MNIRLEAQCSIIYTHTGKSIDNAHPASCHIGSMDSVVVIALIVIQIHSHRFYKVVIGFFVIAYAIGNYTKYAGGK